MILNKEEIIKLAIEWRRKHCTSGARNYDKCERDLNYVLTAYERDLIEQTLDTTVKIGAKYWIGGVRQIDPYDDEIQVHNFVADYIIENILPNDLKDHMKLLKNIFLHIIEHGPIKTDIESLFGQRRQVRAAWDQERIPSKNLITSILQKTLDIAPSKQNLFPFKVHVIEPDNIEDHKSIAGICALFKTGSVNNWEENLDSEAKETDYSKAPWVLVFELRKCDPNIFITAHSEKHNDWSRFNQIREDRYRSDNNVKLASTEIGMFIKLLTGLCLEKDLATSYIMSFPNWSWNGQEYYKDTNSTGYDWSKLPFITEHPIMVVQIGYKANMRDPLATEIEEGDTFQEDKPSFETVVEFHPGVN